VERRCLNGGVSGKTVVEEKRAGEEEGKREVVEDGRGRLKTLEKERGGGGRSVICKDQK